MNWRVFAMSLLRRGNLNRLFKENMSLQYAGNVHTIEQEMEQNAKAIFQYHVKNNPGYRQFLDSRGFDYSDISLLNWKDIPIITKDDLRKYNPVIFNQVYNYTKSGGSTNSPLRYPASKESALRIWPNHWTMHAMCGIVPYEKMLMLMGHHAISDSNLKRLYQWLSQFYTICSFDLTQENADKMYHLIINQKIKFLYGYASSIYIFLRYLRDHNLHLSLKGIFSTSENVVPVSYDLARKYCNCDLFNQYGAHDGDIFAFECSAHDGLHILHNSCTTEIVDNEIYLTATRNYAYPFIRYRVGDRVLGKELIKEKCSCGRTLFRLKGISGRVNDVVRDVDGKEIPVIMFTFPLDEDLSIDKYQVIETSDCIIINIISDKHDVVFYEKRHRPYIQNYLKRPIRFTLNKPLIQLPNKKVPLYILHNILT